MKNCYLFIALLMSLNCWSQKRQQLESALEKQVTVEAKSVYIQAYSTIAELRGEVVLAKKGTLSKKIVLAHFNDEVGGTMGIFSTFDAMDKKLQKSGDAYVQLMYMKEKARIAFKIAAEEDFKAKTSLH